MPPLRTAPQDCGLGGALKDYPCGGVHAMLTWLNASAVKKALNVPPDAYLFLTDNGVGFNYSLTEKNLMPFYREKEPFWGHFLIWNHSKMVRNSVPLCSIDLKQWRRPSPLLSNRAMRASRSA